MRHYVYSQIPSKIDESLRIQSSLLPAPSSFLVCLLSTVLTPQTCINLMPGKKREREDVEPSKKPKKIKFNNDTLKSTSKLAPDEIDFPRGGGSAFTPLEYKKIRTEAFKEADAEVVFEVSSDTDWLPY